MKSQSLKSFKPDSPYKNDPIIILKINKDKYGKEHSNEMVNNYIRQVRYKYWETLFASDMFNKLFTSKLQTEYYEKIQELQNYDFSLYNIEQIQLEIIHAMTKSIEQTIIELFDDLSNKHAYAEYSKNIHYYNGWKTNKAWIINRKVIIPMYGAFSEYSWDNGFKPTNYQVLQKLSDIEKIFNYLDDGSTEPLRLESALKAAEIYNQTRKIETKYFYMTFYKKGTCHLEFKNLDILKKFNIFGSQRKAWLPPTYGKKSYQDMTPEEQAIITEFEGEKEYQKVIANKDYYITTTFTPLMLAS